MAWFVGLVDLATVTRVASEPKKAAAKAVVKSEADRAG